jgi:putative PEP-CTERM system histidine kinase
MVESNWITEPAVWSYATAVIAFAVLAMRLIARWQPGGKPAMLVAFALAMVFAAGAAAGFALTGSAMAWSAALTFDLARNAATLGFLLVFLGVRDSSRSAVRGGTGWISMVCGAVALLGIQWLLGIPAPVELGPARFTHPAGFGIALAISILGLLLVEQCYRRTPPGSRWHVRPMLLGFAGLLAYDLYLYADALLFRELDPEIWAARGFAQAITVPMFLLTLDRARDWSFELSVSRGVLAGSTVLAGTGAFLLLMAGAGFVLRYTGGSWGRALEATLVFAALLLLVMVALSATFRAKVRVFVAKNFFTYRYDYRQEWLKFTTTLTSMTAAQPWPACIQALGDLVESPGGALWLKDGDGRFRQVARVSLPAVEPDADESRAFLAFLRRTGWVLEISDVLSHPSNYEQVSLPAAIVNLPAAWLIVPLQTSEDLVGYVVLTSPRVRIEIDWEVRDLLKTAGRQAASYLAYAQATEALLEARKFEAFNRLSTFVVHDLKNLIAQLQLLLSNVERHRDNPEFQRDMLSTIEHVVGRMHQLTLQLRPDATAGDPAQPVNVAVVASRLRALRAAGRSGLELEVAGDVVAWAHEDRLERVLAHLMQNAFDASGPDPQVRLSAVRAGTQVLIEVSDRGSGMTAEFIRERLFRPFQTTKDTGMGIGMFECQQYVQQLGGHIEVDSSPGNGTRVRIRLRAVSAVAEPEAAA